MATMNASLPDPHEGSGRSPGADRPRPAIYTTTRDTTRDRRESVSCMARLHA